VQLREGPVKKKLPFAVFPSVTELVAETKSGCKGVEYGVQCTDWQGTIVVVAAMPEEEVDQGVNSSLVNRAVSEASLLMNRRMFAASNNPDSLVEPAASVRLKKS
jgi:hypothetical protein